MGFMSVPGVVTNGIVATVAPQAGHAVIQCVQIVEPAGSLDIHGAALNTACNDLVSWSARSTAAAGRHRVVCCCVATIVLSAAY